MQRLSREHGIEIVKNDACMFGMTAADDNGVPGPVLKPTKWMTNAPYLARHLNRRCRGTHQAHVRLLGSKAAQAAIYPPELVEAIVRGLQIQREHDHRAGRADSPLDAAILETMGPTGEETQSRDYSEVKLSTVKEAYDENTGELLDEKLVQKAKREELD